MTPESLPEDIISLILQSCESFSQLHSLMLSSKTIHAVWTCNQRTILWNVGQAAIPGFSDALIAVRATNIAKDSILRGDLPPTPFPTTHLFGTISKPTLDEIQQIQSLSYLAQYLETRTCSPRDKSPNFLPHKWYFDSLSWEPATWNVWREGYHRAIYRYLTAGAVLCPAYYEPILSPEKPRGFLSSLVGLLEGVALQEGDEEGEEYPSWFSEAEQKYLQTIPLYDGQQHEKWETAFKPLEEIFLSESRKQAHAHPTSTTTPLQSKKQGLEKSLYSIFGSKAKNLQSLDPGHAEALFHHILQFLYLVDGDIRCQISLPGDTPAEDTSEPISHSLSCFLFGSFTLMNITIRDNPTTKSPSAFATPTFPILTSATLQATTPTIIEYLGFSNMHNYLKKVWDVSGIPNSYGDPIFKTAPPVSFFVEFMLRKYFGLRFAVRMFNSSVEVRCAWFAFHQFGGVFRGFGPTTGKEGGYVGQDLLEGVDVERPEVWFDEFAWYY
ncbi:hypothetical protein BDV12DRAFT_208177 [Aspergillus spectabilis]